MQDIYIGDEGKGFPLVLLHGFLGSSTMWKPQIDFFKDYFRVITPDLPGFGKSKNAKPHNSIQSLSNLILESLEEKKNWDEAIPLLSSIKEDNMQHTAAKEKLKELLGRMIE